MATAFRQIKIALIVFFFSLFAASSQAAEKRVALVIGNDTYQDVPKLEKAVNDAKAVGEQLKKVGFEVISGTNLNRRQMNQAIGQFVEKVQGGGVGILFYAGHGVQAMGSNFLLPVDIKVKNEQELFDEAIDMQRILERMADAKAKLTMLIIDACRDNPFKKTQGRGIGGTRGLSIPKDTPSGTLVIYSAGAGQQALDSLSPSEKNPNGLFTREFLPLITTPNLQIGDAVKKLKGNVIAKAKSVNHEQNPALYDQTDGDFYFLKDEELLKAKVTPKPAATQPAVTLQGYDPIVIEVEYWKATVQANNEEGYQKYLKKYPQGQFVDMASASLSNLKNKETKRDDAPAGNAQLVQELEDWKKALQANTEEAYKNYLNQYPQGQFVEMAKASLNILGRNNKNVEELNRIQKEKSELQALAKLREKEKEEQLRLLKAEEEKKLKLEARLHQLEAESAKMSGAKKAAQDGETKRQIKILEAQKDELKKLEEKNKLEQEELKKFETRRKELEQKEAAIESMNKRLAELESEKEESNRLLEMARKQRKESAIPAKHQDSYVPPSF